MKKVFILGATGSIGDSTIEVISEFSDQLQLVGLSANKNDEKLSILGEKFNCRDIVLTGKTESSFSNVNLFGMDNLLKTIEKSNADIVINGIAGASGLLPSISTIRSGKDLALANKETMVMAGPLVMDLAEKYGVNLIPVDSEHSAIFNLLKNCEIEDLDEIILTASGGAFRDFTIEELKNVTVKDALKHPTWDMGVKITIDSASMANKGLEIIEAAMLFNVPSEKLKVLIHPQSYVHSLIRKKDCSMYAQISAPDMKLPIQDALFHPRMERVQSTYLDLADKNLTFSKPDLDKFKMLSLAYKALELGNAYTIAYNAANEVLVQSFIDGDIKFLQIPEITERVLNTKIDTTISSIDSILQIDKSVRDLTHSYIG